jgi:protease-4
MNTKSYSICSPVAFRARKSFLSNLAVSCCFAIALLLAANRAPAASTDQSAEEKPRNIVPVFRLEGPLTEAPVDDTLQMFSQTGTSLKDLVKRLNKAASDPEVKAVVILPESMSVGSAQIEELRAAIALIRKKDKDVYVHADALVLGQYILACGASRISVVPAGAVLVPGLHGSSLHVRGLLDKIGVKPDFLTEGAYKSAAELFMREQPSPEADEMMNWLMDSLDASFKDLIAKGRKVDSAKVQSWLDSALFSSEQARTAGLIDAVEQLRDFETMLKDKYGNDVVFDKKYGQKSQLDIDFSSPFAFLKIWTQLLGGGAEKKTEGKPAIGIVYVNGTIVTGKGIASPLGGSVGAFSDDIQDALDKAAKDSSIKAVVLRIDSPGGSATASEIILSATKRLKAKKPFVVSMGNVAGSGGYYVACGADTIFADAATLTGSIGVLAGKLATTEMWKKVGITFKEYKRGQNAGILSTDDVFTESERARMRLFLDDIYATFKGHVTDIRGSRLKKPIDDIAGGRVYTGKQALELGLVDRLGTLNDAVEFAADQARIKIYDVRIVPEPKNFIEQLSEQMSGGKNEPGHIQTGLPDNSLFKLAAPYLQNLDPQRMAAVASALSRLQVLQKEGVVLSMPEIMAQP